MTAIVIAPHPDDETLGCGGAILRHKKNSQPVHWLIVTSIEEEFGYGGKAVATRKREINEVGKAYGFLSIHNLALPPAKLDQIPFLDLVGRIGDIFRTIQPEIVYLPFSGDVHSDHRIVSSAVASCAKWYRFPSVRRVLAYEALSETDQDIDPDKRGFRPNVFMDISGQLERKIEIMKIYSGEMSEFPFPRSEQAIRSLAHVRGAAAGFEAAEGFMLLRERF